MKVALVTSSLSRQGGGVSAVVEELSRHLLATGLDVRVFGLQDAAWLEGGERAWRGAIATACPVIGPAAIGYAPAMIDALLAWGPDIVHVHGIWMHPSRSVLQWARKTARPYVVSPHGMLDPWAVRNSGLKKRAAGLLYEYAHLRGAVSLHALCEPEAQAIRDFGLKQPIHIVPNGVEIPPDRAAQTPPWAGFFPSEARVFLFLGRLHPKKNLLALVSAWALLRNTSSASSGWRLAIAGWDQNNHEAQLRQLAGDLELNDSIAFLGPLFGDAKAEAFAQSSALVLPSLSEGLPMTVLEAWSHGLPVLMTDACNLPEGFTAGAALRLGPSQQDLATALGQFVSLDEASIATMRAAARDLASQEFRWSNVANRIHKLYYTMSEDTSSSSKFGQAFPAN